MKISFFLAIIGIFNICNASEKVHVYEVPLSELNKPGNIYRNVVKSSYIINKRGVAATFSKKKSSRDNMKAILEIAAQYARNNVGGERGRAMSKMLLEMKDY